MHTFYRYRLLLASVCLCGIFTSTPVLSEELLLSGRLILQDGHPGWDENTPAPDSKIKNGHTIGLAVLENGEIAEKQYVFAQSNRADEGSISGYSFYTFENGDYLLVDFEAVWNENGLTGKYLSVIEGTGKFEGATGDGSFSGVAGPWYETILADFTLRIKIKE